MSSDENDLPETRIDPDNPATGLEGSRGPVGAVPGPDAEPPIRVEVHPGKEAVVDFDPARTFECVPECTWCCYHGVYLYENEFYVLAEHADLNETTTQYRGHDFIRREPKDRAEHVDIDGEACTFLDEQGHCELHADVDWKPARCSVFPLDVTVQDEEIHIGIRDDAERNCDGLGVSERRIVEHLDAFLPPVLWDVDDPTTKIGL